MRVPASNAIHGHINDFLVRTGLRSGVSELQVPCFTAGESREYLISRSGLCRFPYHTPNPNRNYPTENPQPQTTSNSVSSLTGGTTDRTETEHLKHYTLIEVGNTLVIIIKVYVEYL